VHNGRYINIKNIEYLTAYFYICVHAKEKVSVVKYFIEKCDKYSDCLLKYYIENQENCRLKLSFVELVEQKKANILLRLSSYIGNFNYRYKHQLIIKIAVKNNYPEVISVFMKNIQL
jgi:hypothetical protein